MVLIVLFFGLLIVALVGLFQGWRWAAAVSFAAAAVGLIISLAGGITDKDPASFFAYEVGVFPVLLFLTALVWRRSQGSGSQQHNDLT
jgi:hypothetical protein